MVNGYSSTHGRNEEVKTPKVVSMFGDIFDNAPELDGEITRTLTVCKSITTETAHRLMDYEGKCAHIHGHSWQWEVCVEVDCLQQNGIGVDFGTLKGILTGHIHDLFDHSLVLSESDPLVDKCEAEGRSLEHLLGPGNGLPGRVVLMDCNPTSENMALYAKSALYAEFMSDADLADHIVSVRVKVNETCTSAAEV